ncbi:hypothetical protein DFH09DRAFT_1287851 [Mycena vulgaris]|nr:hypothetical protein DFH09DRAFT_1287851 [Mycena vulgaris]
MPDLMLFLGLAAHLSRRRDIAPVAGAFVRKSQPTLLAAFSTDSRISHASLPFFLYLLCSLESESLPESESPTEYTTSTIRMHLTHHLSLNNAAAEVLGISVDKLYQKGVNWKREPHDAHKLYAALDAVISLRLYENLAPVLQADGASQGKAVPEDWYTFNSTMGETVRTRLSVRGEEVPWSTKDCSCANTKSEKRACLSATAGKTGWRVTYEVPSMQDEVEEG